MFWKPIVIIVLSMKYLDDQHEIILLLFIKIRPNILISVVYRNKNKIQNKNYYIF